MAQLRTLTWTVNFLLVALAAGAGRHFAAAHEARGDRATVEWPESALEDGGVAARLDTSDLPRLLDIPVNGFEPKPPVITGGDEDPDPIEEFQSRCAYVGLIHSLSDAYDAIAYVRDASGATHALRPGERLGEFTLIGLDADAEGGRRSLVFSTPRDERLARLTSSDVSPAVFSRAAETPLLSPYTDLARPPVERDRIAVPAFRARLEDPSGATWFVTREERAWWARYGTAEVVSALETEVVSDASGTPIGVRLLSQPGADSPITDGRGLRRDDVVRCVDDRVVTSAAEVFAHLVARSPERLRCVIEVVGADGAPRTVVHRLAR